MTAVRSELLQPKSWIIRHPCVTAAGWFGTFGAIAGGVVGLGAVGFYAAFEGAQPVLHYVLWGGSFAAAGVVAALPPALLLGQRVLQSDRVTSARAAKYVGVNIAALSVLWPMVLGAPVAILLATCARGCDNIISTLNFFIGIVTATVCGTILLWVVTIPLGQLGGHLLYRLRERALRPIGCSIHGYREVDGAAK